MERRLFCKGLLEYYQKGEDLKILQISDLHVDHTNGQHDLIWKNLEYLVSKSDIDLTVITGDWTSDADNLPATETLIEVMERCSKPWAVIFGNHDSQGKLSRKDLASLFEKAEHCLFARGPEDLSGVGNYVINVYNHQDPSHLDASLILLDSHTDTNRTLQYEPIYRDQVKWYEKILLDSAPFTVRRKTTKQRCFRAFFSSTFPLKNMKLRGMKVKLIPQSTCMVVTMRMFILL